MGNSGTGYSQSGVKGMFMGEFQHSIDSKGRLIIPSRFRPELGEKFVLTKGLDRCLFAYPWAEWTTLEKKLKALPFTKADARAFVRFFFSGAAECELDRQGRILIPSMLRDYARLEKDVVVIGVSTRVEIWSGTAWKEYNEATGSDYEAIAEKMENLNLEL